MRRSKRGATSVFLMISFVSILLVIAILTEVVSSAVARSYGTAVLELAGRSALSNYCLFLKEDYGLFGIEMDEAEIKEEVLYYWEQILQPKKNLDDDNIKLLNLKMQELEIYCDEYPLTNCELFEKQIVDYMKYRALGDVLMDLNGEEAERKLQKQQNEIDELLQEKKKLSNATELMKKIKEMSMQYESALEEIKKLELIWERWQQIKGSNSENAQQDAILLEKQLLRTWTRIQRQFKFIERQIGEIRAFYADGTQFGQSGESMMQQVETIKREIQIFITIDVEKLDAAFSMLKKEEEGKKQRISLKQKIKNYETLFFDPQSGVDSSDENKKNENTRYLRNDSVKNQLPSLQMGESSRSFSSMDTVGTQINLLTKTKYQFLLNQYIFHMFATRMTEERKKETFFKNEVEYLLFGNFEEGKNQRKAEQGIFALRVAANLVYLYSNAEKQQLLASTAASMTPGPGAPVTQCLLASLWSCAEAQNDVKVLLNGGKIPFFKSDESWALSLKAVLSGKNHTTVDRKLSNGLSYDNYLNLFLVCSNRETILVRMMDLIQINLQGRYDRGFLLYNCKGGFLLKGEICKKSILGEPKALGILRKGKVTMSHVY